MYAIIRKSLSAKTWYQSKVDGMITCRAGNVRLFSDVKSAIDVASQVGGSVVKYS